MARKYRVPRSGKPKNTGMTHFEVTMRSLGYSALDFDSMTLPQLYERLCIHAEIARNANA